MSYNPHGQDWGTFGGPPSSWHGLDTGNLGIGAGSAFRASSFDRFNYFDTHIGDIPRGLLGPRCYPWDDTKIDPIASYGSDIYFRNMADSVGPSIKPKEPYKPIEFKPIETYKPIEFKPIEPYKPIKYQPIEPLYFDITPMKSTETFSTNLDYVIEGLRSVDKFHPPSQIFPYASHEQIYNVAGQDQDSLPSWLVKPFGSSNRHSLLDDLDDYSTGWDDDLDDDDYSTNGDDNYDVPEVW
jgi:hypothetical protein